MQKVTVVNFRAFDKAMRETFIDQTEQEIHGIITDVCNTAVITKVTEFTKASEKENFDFLTQNNNQNAGN